MSAKQIVLPGSEKQWYLSRCEQVVRAIEALSQDRNHQDAWELLLKIFREPNRQFPVSPAVNHLNWLVFFIGKMHPNGIIELRTETRLILGLGLSENDRFDASCLEKCL